MTLARLSAPALPSATTISAVTVVTVFQKRFLHGDWAGSGSTSHAAFCSGPKGGRTRVAVPPRERKFHDGPFCETLFLR